jgi:hypothetical protein
MQLFGFSFGVIHNGKNYLIVDASCGILFVWKFEYGLFKIKYKYYW